MLKLKLMEMENKNWAVECSNDIDEICMAVRKTLTDALDTYDEVRCMFIIFSKKKFVRNGK